MDFKPWNISKWLWQPDRPGGYGLNGLFCLGGAGISKLGHSDSLAAGPSLRAFGPMVVFLEGKYRTWSSSVLLVIGAILARFWRGSSFRS